MCPNSGNFAPAQLEMPACIVASSGLTQASCVQRTARPVELDAALLPTLQDGIVVAIAAQTSPKPNGLYLALMWLWVVLSSWETARWGHERHELHELAQISPN